MGGPARYGVSLSRTGFSLMFSPRSSLRGLRAACGADARSSIARASSIEQRRSRVVARRRTMRPWPGAQEAARRPAKTLVPRPERGCVPVRGQGLRRRARRNGSDATPSLGARPPRASVAPGACALRGGRCAECWWAPPRPDRPLDTTSTLAGAVTPSSSKTPRRRRSRFELSTTPRTVTRYSFSTWYRGWRSRAARSPSLVSTRRPVLLRSSLPTGKTRARAGTHSITVGRPRLSETALRDPRGLVEEPVLLLLADHGAVRPPVLPEQSGSTEAPSSAVLPSTITRPERMRSSQCRREPRPASARNFCRRSAHSGTERIPRRRRSSSF